MGKSNPMKRGAHYHLAKRDYSVQMRLLGGFSCLRVEINCITSAHRTPAIAGLTFVYRGNQVDAHNEVAKDLCPGIRP
jgi:hypothetical protein